MSVAEESPSTERRKALKEADAANELRVLGSYPLPKYIDIADRLLEHFQDALDGRRLDEAYVFGLRFANLCLSSLPQHPEWKRDTSGRGRKRLTSQVGDVLCMMDVIKQRMDAEELMKIKAEMVAKQEEDARKKEAEDRKKRQLDEAQTREQKIRDALEEERTQFLAKQRDERQEEVKQKQKVAKGKEKNAKQNDVEKSAMAKLQAMQAQMSSMAEEAPQNQEKVRKTKKNTEKSKVAKAKTKESKQKMSFGWGKKKSNLKPKEEIATLPQQNPTQPSAVIDIKDDTHALPVASIVEKKVAMSENQPASTGQQDNQSQISERKNAASAENQESKTKSENIVKIKIDPNQKSKLDTSSVIKLNKNDSDSARSVTSKKSTPMSFIKSTFEAAKSSIPTMPSAMLQPSIKGSVNDSTNRPTAKESVNGSAKSTAKTIIAAQQTPRSRKEKATIDKLKRAISIQEDRLEYIEGKQIPSLLEAAKACLKEDKKKEALKCLAHKKRLERQVDTTKAAVFNMETQMFMLESAMEDRHVKKALDEAANAIAGFQQNIGDPNAAALDLRDMSASLPELDIGDSTDEELMEELEQWLSPEDKKKSQERKDDDDISLLSMPAFLPMAPATAPTSPSADRILSAAIGE